MKTIEKAFVALTALAFGILVAWREVEWGKTPGLFLMVWAFVSALTVRMYVCLFDLLCPGWRKKGQ